MRPCGPCTGCCAQRADAEAERAGRELLARPAAAARQVRRGRPRRCRWSCWSYPTCA
jgi:hypothetical protein